MPSLSPKGTFFVLDDETIAFGEIRSPNTVANLKHLDKTEVNFIDVFSRKGVRVFGTATIAEKGSGQFESLFPRWADAFGELADRMNAIVIIKAERVKPLTTPPYDDGANEEDMIATYKAKFAEIYP